MAVVPARKMRCGEPTRVERRRGCVVYLEDCGIQLRCRSGGVGHALVHVIARYLQQHFRGRVCRPCVNGRSGTRTS